MTYGSIEQDCQESNLTARCSKCGRMEGEHFNFGNWCPDGSGRAFTALGMCEMESGESRKGAGDSWPCCETAVVFDLRDDLEKCLKHWRGADRRV